MMEIARAMPQAISELTGSWNLDPGRTTIQFRTKAMWVLTVDGTFAVTEGHGTINGDGRVTGRLVIDANSINTHNKRRDEHLRGKDFFDTKKYPTMTFDLTGVRFGVQERVTVNGNFSIRDVSQPVEFQATLKAERDGTLTLDAHTDIDRGAWGLGWTKMGAGLHNRVAVRATLQRCSLDPTGS